MNSGWRSARERLVAEAAGDLVVALVAGHHQQLLEQLRRLRQRVEGARADARRDEEVARALGRRAREDRRLDVEEVVRVEVVAHGAGDRVAQRQRVAHRVAPQVDHAVAQAQRLVDRRVVVERERRRLGRGQVLGLAHRQLDLAGLQPRVLLALLAADDLAGHADRVLGAQLLGELVRLRRVLGVEDELQDAGAVAQVDEHQAAVVAAAVDPAGHADGVADARGVELAGPRVAVGVGPRRSHRRMWCITVSVSTVRCSPDSMSFSAVPSSPRMATYRACARCPPA